MKFLTNSKFSILGKYLTLALVLFMAESSAVVLVNGEPHHLTTNGDVTISWTSSAVGDLWGSRAAYKVEEYLWGSLINTHSISSRYTKTLSLTRTQKYGYYYYKVFYWRRMGSGGSYLLDGSASFAVMQGTPEITYKYDALGRLIKVTDSMNGDRDYDFDPAGNRKEVGNN